MAKTATKRGRAPMVLMEKTVLTVSEAAAMLNAHPNSIRRWADPCLLPSFRIGLRGDRRFRVEDTSRIWSIPGSALTFQGSLQASVRGSCPSIPSSAPSPCALMCCGIYLVALARLNADDANSVCRRLCLGLAYGPAGSNIAGFSPLANRRHTRDFSPLGRRRNTRGVKE